MSSSSLYVVFTQDVPQVASKNTLKRVRRGYFSNYLMPQGFAKMATPNLLEKLKVKIEGQKNEALMAQATLSEQAKKLLGKVIKLQAKASPKGTLFRAVSEKSLVEAIKAQIEVDVEKSQLKFEPIKKIGNHSVIVKFGEHEVKVTVEVEAKG